MNYASIYCNILDKKCKVYNQCPFLTEDEAEKENINQAAESCRKILNHVNEEVKLMENLLVRTFSTSSFKKTGLCGSALYMHYYIPACCDVFI